MVIELNGDEAIVLIATLIFSEGVALAGDGAMTNALAVLRPFRTRLLQAYLRSQVLREDATVPEQTKANS